MSATMRLPTPRQIKELQQLEQRLENGWEKVRAAEGTPQGHALTDFFLKLLREYEELSDELYGTKRKPE